jgi:hypothetical protein
MWDTQEAGRQEDGQEAAGRQGDGSQKARQAGRRGRRQAAMHGARTGQEAGIH